MSDPEDYLEEMMGSIRGAQHEQMLDRKTTLALNIKTVKLRERQVIALEELVVEIRRLRVTGIQP